MAGNALASGTYGTYGTYGGCHGPLQGFHVHGFCQMGAEPRRQRTADVRIHAITTEGNGPGLIACRSELAEEILAAPIRQTKVAKDEIEAPPLHFLVRPAQTPRFNHRVAPAPE